MTEKARILFVDDEKRVLNSMRGLFRRDFELFLTTEGSAAIKIAAEADIDVIVADQRMPGMTGIEVLGKVKELSPRTVRILLTGYADPQAVEGSINIGEVFRFLNKPCPPQVLRESLQLAVDAARAKPARELPAPVLVAANEPTTEPASRETRPTPRPVPRPLKIILNAPPVAKTEPRPTDLRSRALAITKDVGVVIFTVDPTFAEIAIRAVSADRDTILATSLTKVALAIERNHAGVLLTDFTSKSAVLQKIISALKQSLPELVTIVASDSRDTTDMISLINRGQIFRYVLKPIDASHIRDDITAAAVKHLQLLKNPEMAKRHRVVRPDAADSSPTIKEFVGRIQNIQSRRLSGSDKSS